MSQKSMGRPVDPKSERSLKPWLKLEMSRASFYWRKRYGDLPKAKRRRAAPRERELTINDI
jgi:hypothetical protein